MIIDTEIIIVGFCSWAALMGLVTIFGIIAHQRLKEYKNDYPTR